jgi:hypothetical protein
LAVAGPSRSARYARMPKAAPAIAAHLTFNMVTVIALLAA